MLPCEDDLHRVRQNHNFSYSSSTKSGALLQRIWIIIFFFRKQKGLTLSSGKLWGFPFSVIYLNSYVHLLTQKNWALTKVSCPYEQIKTVLICISQIYVEYCLIMSTEVCSRKIYRAYKQYDWQSHSPDNMYKPTPTISTCSSQMNISMFSCKKHLLEHPLEGHKVMDEKSSVDSYTVLQ